MFGFEFQEPWSRLWDARRSTPLRPRIVFAHRSYEVETDAADRELVTPNQALLENPGLSFVRIGRPLEALRVDWLEIDPRRLMGILRRLGKVLPGGEVRPDRPFLVSAACLDSRAFLVQRTLWRHLGVTTRPRGESVSILAEQLTKHLLATSLPPTGRPRRRRATHLRNAHSIQDAKRYILAHLAEKISVPRIAHAGRLSPSHLAELFPVHTGFTPHRFVMELRLREAYRQLQAYRGDLAALGLELGFSSGNHFSNAFKSHFGLAPTRALGVSTQPTAEALADLARRWGADRALFPAAPTGAQADLETRRTGTRAGRR